MFYSHIFLAKKSPLGLVWIAAHLEQRIKKHQIDAIDIPSCAEYIIFPEAPISLRLSGHLLLGLVKIYSRKVNYLFQDYSRILMNTRTVVSVPINLPADANCPIFGSITVPESLELDKFELDDWHTDDLENHQKDYEQINLTDEWSSGQGQYVAFCISEESKEKNGFFQRFDDDNSAQEFPEIEVMREAMHNFEPVSLVELDTSNEHPAPVTMGKDSLSHIIEDLMPPGVESWPPPSHCKTPTVALPDDSNVLNRGISLDQPLPDLELQPSPPVREQKARRIKRKQMYDLEIVLTNVEMKRQLGDTTKLVSKRRKLPCSVVDVWRYQRKCLPEQIRHELLTVGSASDFRRTFETDILPTAESFTRDESVSFDPGVSLFSLEEERLPDNTAKDPSGSISAEKDFDFLDESNASSGYQESKARNLSARTRAVAHYFKSQSPSQIQDSEPGVLSLNNILEGRTRKQCARMFCESLVLKNYGFIDVQQKEPYGEIRISPMPTLFSTQF